MGIKTGIKWDWYCWYCRHPNCLELQSGRSAVQNVFGTHQAIVLLVVHMALNPRLDTNMAKLAICVKDYNVVCNPLH